MGEDAQGMAVGRKLDLLLPASFGMEEVGYEPCLY